MRFHWMRERVVFEVAFEGASMDDMTARKGSGQGEVGGPVVVTISYDIEQRQRDGRQ